MSILAEFLCPEPPRQGLLPISGWTWEITALSSGKGGRHSIHRSEVNHPTLMTSNMCRVVIDRRRSGVCGDTGDLVLGAVLKAYGT